MKEENNHYVVVDKLDEFHSFESFFKIDYLSDESLRIRFVDIGIDNHLINESNNIKFIDKSILNALNIVYLKINQEVLIDKNQENNIESSFFGGYDILEKGHKEIEIKASFIEILLPLDYKLSDKKWFSIEELSNPSNHLLRFLKMNVDDIS